MASCEFVVEIEVDSEAVHRHVYGWRRWRLHLARHRLYPMSWLYRRAHEALNRHTRIVGAPSRR